jgi:CRISPR-associated protein Cas6
VGVHPIRGRLVGDRALALTPASRLTLRLPTNRIHETLPLAGQKLDIDGAVVSLGIPTVRPLDPAAALLSPLVVIKGFMDPESFLAAADRQAKALGLSARLALVARTTEAPVEGKTPRPAGEPIRRTLRIRDKTIVGFALAAVELTAAESIRIQEHGLGGRRRFGCGLFLPIERRMQ